MQINPDMVDVIAPNLKRRYAGVTSTVFRLVPVQAGKIYIATTGPVLLAENTAVPAWKTTFSIALRTLRLPRMAFSLEHRNAGRGSAEICASQALKIRFYFGCTAP